MNAWKIESVWNETGGGRFWPMIDNDMKTKEVIFEPGKQRARP